MAEKEMFLTRLYMEWKAFREEMLAKGKDKVFRESGRIEAHANLFGAIVGLTDELDQADYGKLLLEGDGFLEYVYREWMNYEDGARMEMRRFVAGIMKRYAKKGAVQRPETARITALSREIA